jgi:hypothetical protein
MIVLQIFDLMISFVQGHGSSAHHKQCVGGKKLPPATERLRKDLVGVG